MNPSTASSEPLPAAPFLAKDEHGKPYILATRCGKCGARHPGPRLACGRCGARDNLEPYHAAETGRLHTYTVVYRSTSGVKTPFIAAIVDLDDGISLSGVLHGVDPDPASIRFDLPVRVVYGDALGRKDAAGNSYYCHFFEPMEPAR